MEVSPLRPQSAATLQAGGGAGEGQAGGLASWRDGGTLGKARGLPACEALWTVSTPDFSSN